MTSTAVATLRSTFSESFTALGSDRGQDRKVVVTSWPSVPVEVVHAAGLTPVIARGSAAATADADKVLEAGVFPNRIRQLLQAALSGRLAHTAAIVLPRTSDVDYKAYLYLQELRRRGRAPMLPPVLLFDLLQTQGAEIPAYNMDRVRDLLARLSKISGHEGGAEGLRAQIVHGNDARAAARRLATLRRDPARVSGAEMLPLLGARWSTPPERYAGLADDARNALAARPMLPGRRVMLAGMPVDSTALHAAIEPLGAVVVDEISPFSTHEGSGSVDAAADPFAAVAKWYGTELVTARSPGEMLMRRIEESLAGIDVVIFLLPPDDARFGWDVPRLRAVLEARSIGHAIVRSDPECGLSESEFASIRAALGQASASQAVRHG